MSSLEKIRPRDSIVLRLTLLYAGVSLVSLIAVLVATYLILDRTLQAELDADIAKEVIEYEGILASQGLNVLADVLDHEAESEGLHRAFNRVLTLEGVEVAQSDLSAWPDHTINPELVAQAAAGLSAFDTLHRADRDYPVRVHYHRLGDSHIVEMGLLADEKGTALENYRRVFVIASLLFMVLSFGLGGLVARSALSGVRRVTDTARQIASGEWDSRVHPGDRQDEIAELARAFNDMIERIQKLIGELRDVTDDIAHDLRTPIARINVAAETCLQDANASEDSRELAGSVLEECDRLLQLINTMLEISQTEAGARPMKADTVDLSVIAEDVCDLFRPAAEDKNLRLQFVPQSDLLVSVDRQRLSRAIAHIVDNALKYTEPGGHIDVRCERRDGKAVVAVRDTGIGIPADALDRVFDRFYRVERSRSGAGTGLGLSAARAICVAHGGSIRVTSEPGRGSTFEVILPAL